MHRDSETNAQVITPGGLILPAWPLEDWPAPVRDHFRKAGRVDSLDDADEAEADAAQALARLTGCRVTVETVTRATCAPPRADEGAGS